MKTPQEYREKVAKITTIELPSGLECKIRPVPSMVILELTNQAEAEKLSLDEFLQRNFNDSLDAVIPSSVVSPKLLPARKEGEELDENALFLDELVIGDLNFLFTEIVKISGISKEDVEKYKSFPEQSGGPSPGIDM
jgi:hypothetical protein